MPSMYEISVPVFQQMLGGLAGVLDKGQAHFAARKVDDVKALAARLYPDMLALSNQVQIASDHAKGATARLAGMEVPSWPDDEVNFDQLKARIAKTLDFIKAVKPEQMAGAETRKVVMKTRAGDREYTGQNYLLTFAMPNFYFHVTTAYNILRGCGVEIGKRDFMGARPQ